MTTAPDRAGRIDGQACTGILHFWTEGVACGPDGRSITMTDICEVA